jgi:hypothetical protein
MSKKHIQAGDIVWVNIATDLRRVGIVSALYPFEGKTRCVVEHADDTESIVFDYEVFTDSDQTH